jgi:CheY-like chemotaxis protein
MATSVLICDDSSFARRQMAQALPRGWDVNVHFAADGGEGLAAIKAGRADVLFLDLNMPGMDGYQVLEAIRREDLPTLAIVVSGDVQPQARERILKLGAMGFVKKPVRPQEIADLLATYGIRPSGGGERPAVAIEVDALDGCREIANVAMGQAADFLARLLGAFVLMPVPTVRMIEPTELRALLRASSEDEQVSAVCQGFIGAGLAGEALLVFHESSYADIAELLRHEGAIDDHSRIELLMDIANVLIGACLKGLSEQLNLGFSQGHPMVLGHHLRLADLLHDGAQRWRRTLAIEMAFRIEDRRIVSELLLLFTEDSLAALEKRIASILG